MGTAGEEVNALGGLGDVAQFPKIGKITGEGCGVTGDIHNPLG